MYTPKSGSLVSGAPNDYTPRSGALDTQSLSQPNLQQPQQKLPSWLHVLFPALTSGVGAVIGGVGGAMVPFADATGIPEYAGGVAGAGVGASLGQGAMNGIEHLLGGQSPSSMTGQLGSMANAGQTGATSQAIGGPLAKALGFAFHPIANLGGYVNSQLAKSPAKIDIADLLNQYSQKVLPQLYKEGVGSKADQAYKTLTSDVTGMTKAYQPHIGVDAQAPTQSQMNLVDLLNGSTGNPSASLSQTKYVRMGGVKPGVGGPPGYLKPITTTSPLASDYAAGQQYGLNTNITPNVNTSDMNVSIADANQMKRDIMKSAKQYYSQSNEQPDIQSRALFGSLLKSQIAKQSPVTTIPLINKGIQTVPLANWGMHKMYSTEDNADALIRAFPFLGTLLNKGGGMGLKMTQKAIPANGGYLNKLLPFLGNTTSNSQAFPQ